MLFVLVLLIFCVCVRAGCVRCFCCYTFFVGRGSSMRFAPLPYLCVVAEDGSVLPGVELELPVGQFWPYGEA